MQWIIQSLKDCASCRGTRLLRGALGPAVNKAGQSLPQRPTQDSRMKLRDSGSTATRSTVRFVIHTHLIHSQKLGTVLLV